MDGENLIYLFLLSTVNSGSTLLKKIISTSPFVTTFKGEGLQLDELKKRYNLSFIKELETLDWAFIKEVYNKHWNSNKPVHFDKQPLYLYYTIEITKFFKNPYLVILLRNPYAVVEGILRREWMNSIDEAINYWVDATEILLKTANIHDDVLLIKYEDLCKKPNLIINEIINFCPRINSLQIDDEYHLNNVTSNKINGIKNLNELKIQNLTPIRIRRINKYLSESEKLLNRLGYELEDKG